MDRLEAKMDEAIQVMESLGYKPTTFKGMIEKHGTLIAMKRLINDPAPSDGFTRLWQMNRLDLSIENIVISEDWGDKFTANEIKKARRKLIDAKFIKE